MEAARRQLHVAISLWFAAGDPIAIHTLAFAAHDVTCNLLKKRGLAGLWDEAIKSAWLTRWMKALKKDYNFFKHADVDPKAVLDFNPELTELIIMATIDARKRLGAIAMPLELLFSSWCMLHYPGMFTETLGDKLSQTAHAALRQLSREEFYQAYNDACEAGVMPPAWQ
jgi:hypothetical protein